MPVGDKQKLITTLVSEALQEPAQIDKKFPWFINVHKKDHFQDSFDLVDRIFNQLQGGNVDKQITSLRPDAYFGGGFNFLFEFDEFQHFSSARLKALNLYSKAVKTNYCIDDWKSYCRKFAPKADKYRYNKITVDFNFSGGRTCQRAYLDCFRDFLPEYNGLNPTLRISEFEVSEINSTTTNNVKLIKKLIDTKLLYK
jgi:hypothetical protein